jgi:hypothetical protein
MARLTTSYQKEDTRTNVIKTFGEYGFYSELRYRGEPAREPGEQASLLRTRIYNGRFADAIGMGMSLADAHDYASETA